MISKSCGIEYCYEKYNEGCGERTDESIESTQIVLADAFAYPHTVMVIPFNADITILAVFSVFIFVSITKSTVSLVGLCDFYFILAIFNIFPD